MSGVMGEVMVASCVKQNYVHGKRICTCPELCEKSFFGGRLLSVFSQITIKKENKV